MKLLLVAVGAVLAVGFAAPSSAPLPAVAPGVTVNGVKVGGLGSESARAVVRSKFEKPLTILYGSERWTVRPQGLGVRASADQAVRHALEAKPGAAVTLPVAVSSRNIRAYVEYLHHKYSRAPVDARVVGTNGLTPVIADGVPGRRVAMRLMQQRIEKALRSPVYRTIALATKPVSPRVTKQTYGPVIVIGRSSHRLRLFDGQTFVREFGVATGQSAYPTPLGTFTIVTMQRDPWWIPPPNSAWAAGEKPIPPGPGNPLGTRWMGLSAAAVGIHGTPDAASIGYSASHGCIRMRVPDAEWLFNHVRVGTTVAIVDA
ncbi:MAG TPA: L,D-transpeptidase family protein [Gaiellaceae bacterium]|nr:L,D-transpeptidase family protein [Gaiellaceae bacterium]